MLLHAHQFCYRLIDHRTHDNFLLHGCADDPMVSQLFAFHCSTGEEQRCLPCMMSKVNVGGKTTSIIKHFPKRGTRQLQKCS